MEKSKDKNLINRAKKIDFYNFRYKYSICTLVNNMSEYKDMIDSYIKKGFNTNNSEFLYIDNTENNSFDGYSGLNIFLSKAEGEYVILCHQDVLITDDNEKKLREKLFFLDKMDRSWGLAGNAGGIDLSKLAVRITDPGGTSSVGSFPEKVKSLDENFIIVNHKNRICLSGDLSGFHLYGSDICIIANILGYTSYVINFHLTHKGTGKIDQSFLLCKHNLIRKYNQALKGQFIRTTCSRFFISSSRLLSFLFNKKRILNIVSSFKL